MDQSSGSAVGQDTTIVTAKTYSMTGGILNGNVQAATFLKTGGTLNANALVVAEIDVRADGGTIVHAAKDGIEVSNQLDRDIAVKTTVPIDNTAAGGIGIKATTEKGTVSVDVAGKVTGAVSAIDITTQEGGITLKGAGEMTGGSQHRRGRQGLGGGQIRDACQHHDRPQRQRRQQWVLRTASRPETRL